MSTLIETDRLLLRELRADDAPSMFAMDSDPEVHRYLGNAPVVNPAQSQEHIAFIQQQYRENGIGRWAVLEREAGDFVGWSGLKLIPDPLQPETAVYELGYRFLQRHWGRGYATEAARAVLRHGFEKLGLAAIYSMADGQNHASNHVLRKLDFVFVDRFDLNGVPHNWYQLLRPQ